MVFRLCELGRCVVSDSVPRQMHSDIVRTEMAARPYAFAYDLEYVSRLYRLQTKSSLPSSVVRAMQL